jgi:hypothetical protein
MYTGGRRKRFPEVDAGSTLLGSAVAAAVHGNLYSLQQIMLEYFRADESKDLAELAELLLGILGEIHIEEEATDQQNLVIDRAAEELRNCHRQFRAALVWLCSPKQSEPAPQTSLKLLASGKWRPGRYPNISKRSERYIRYFETHGLRHFKIDLSLQDDRLLPFPNVKHLVDVFCAYLLDRCLGRKTSEMPIKICPTCSKLFLSERKQFCSTTCQWKSYWTAERRADDKWVKDLEKFAESCEPKYLRSVADLREKLARPKYAQRLESIKKRAKEEDWTGWIKILERIESIEKLVAEAK